MRSRLAPMVAGLVLWLAALQGASAQTIGYAEAYDRIAKSCGSDIERYCGNVALGGGAVKACLERNQAKVSAQCKAVSAEAFELLAKRASAQARARTVCDRDAQQYCRGVQPHDGYQLQCLLKASHMVSTGCNQTITDAGWR